MGDAACWLHLLCPACDAVVEDEELATCPRCGAVLVDRRDEEQEDDDGAGAGTRSLDE